MKLKESVKLLFVILFSFLLISFSLAQQDETSAVSKAYSCLEKELGSNCGGTKSTKQAAFNLLAGSYDSSIQSSCLSTLNDLKKDNCWPDSDTGTCNIKSTALAALALQHIGKNIDKEVNYLLGNKKIETGLTWYLEIDSNNKTTCTINGKSIVIEDNKKISGSPPDGLLRAYNDYWFQISDIKKNYTISCDKNFITALLYQKSGSDVFYISSETKSASEFDSITETVNSFCLKTGNECDYEGTLWASLVLKKEGKEITPLIPYLTSMSDRAENRKFIPSAMLYILTNEDEYYSELISLQKSGSFWDESRNKFYDTALALLSLQSVNSDAVESAKKYLLKVQKENGCWQSDTSFILHAGWPKNPNTLSGGSGGLTYCQDFGNFCVQIGECSLADTLDNFYCSSAAQVCCKLKQQKPSCSEKGGFICNLDQECSGSLETSLDTNSCCIGDCTAIQTENECESFGFFCKDSCSDSQEEKAGYSSSCSLGQICCGPKSETKSSNIWLIILLIALIILVVLAIIFRNQLKIFIFKRKSGFKSGSPVISSSRPGPPRFFQPQFQQKIVPRNIPKRSSLVDKEFEETMRKLKDMSK